METSRMAADGRSEWLAPLRRLRDEIIDLYLDRREEAAARSYADVLVNGERFSQRWGAP
jgi:hypothetical protein